MHDEARSPWHRTSLTFPPFELVGLERVYCNHSYKIYIIHKCKTDGVTESCGAGEEDECDSSNLLSDVGTGQV